MSRLTERGRDNNGDYIKLMYDDGTEAADIFYSYDEAYRGLAKLAEYEDKNEKPCQNAGMTKKDYLQLVFDLKHRLDAMIITDDMEHLQLWYEAMFVNLNRLYSNKRRDIENGVLWDFGSPDKE